MEKKYFPLLIFLLLLIIGLGVFNLFGIKWLYKTSESKFLCPVPKEYCRKGKVIEFENNYFGIGYKVPVGTPVYAVFSGQAKGGKVSYAKRLGEGKYPTILLSSAEGDLEVVYTLSGPDYLELKDTERGEIVEKAREGNIASFDINVLVRVDKLSGKGRETLIFKPSDFLSR